MPLDPTIPLSPSLEATPVPETSEEDQISPPPTSITTGDLQSQTHVPLATMDSVEFIDKTSSSSSTGLLINSQGQEEQRLRHRGSSKSAKKHSVIYPAHEENEEEEFNSEISLDELPEKLKRKLRREERKKKEKEKKEKKLPNKKLLKVKQQSGARALPPELEISRSKIPTQIYPLKMGQRFARYESERNEPWNTSGGFSSVSLNAGVSSSA